MAYMLLNATLPELQRGTRLAGYGHPLHRRFDRRQSTSVCTPSDSGFVSLQHFHQSWSSRRPVLKTRVRATVAKYPVPEPVLTTRTRDPPGVGRACVESFAIRAAALRMYSPWLQPPHQRTAFRTERVDSPTGRGVVSCRMVHSLVASYMHAQ